MTISVPNDAVMQAVRNQFIDSLGLHNNEPQSNSLFYLEDSESKESQFTHGTDMSQWPNY